MTATRSPLAPGDIVHGFAYGTASTFSRYTCSRVEAVGPDWIVTRNPGGQAALVSGNLDLQLAQEGRDEPCPNEDGCQLYPPEPRLTTYQPTT